MDMHLIDPSHLNQRDAEGKQHGMWEEHLENSILRGTYDHGEKHGDWVRMKKNYMIMEEMTFTADVLNGTFKSFHDNRFMKIHCTFVQGIRCGSYRSWHDNGASEFDYSLDEFGELHGRYRHWDRKFNEVEDSIYEHGKFVGGV